MHAVTFLYNPPALITNNLKTIIDLIDHICLKYHFVIFIGNFNLPFLTENVNIVPYSKCSTLVDWIIEFGLQQLVKELSKGHNILDMVFCSEFISYEDVLVSPPFASSDHCSLEININVLSEENINLGDKFIYYSKCDFNQFNIYLNSIDWNSLLANTDNVNSLWDRFVCVINYRINLCVPMV